MLEAGRLKYALHTGITLIPQPSDDINDPLNWPKWKKAVAFLGVCFYTFLTAWALGGIVLAIPDIIQEWHVGLNEVVHGLISWNVLTLGAGVSLKFKPIGTLIDTELLLDSYSALFRKATGFPLRFLFCFRNINLVCQSKLLGELESM